MQVLQHGSFERPLERIYRRDNALSLVQLDVDLVLKFSVELLLTVAVSYIQTNDSDLRKTKL